MSEDPTFIEGRRLMVGHPAPFGARAVRKRLALMNSLWPLTGDRVLDVGCGDGTYTIEIAKGFRESFGIDIEPNRLETFRERKTDINVMEMSTERLSFPDAYFDVVTAIEVIEHIEDVEAGLREIRRVLKPEGAFVITCPNRLFPIETHQLRYGLNKKLMPGLPWIPPLHDHVATARTYTRRSLRALGERCGLHLVSNTYMMPPFDRSAIGAHLHRFADRMERVPIVRAFGVSNVACFVRA